MIGRPSSNEVSSSVSAPPPHTGGRLIMLGAAALGGLVGFGAATFSGPFAALRPIASHLIGDGPPRQATTTVRIPSLQPTPRVVQNPVSTNNRPTSVPTPPSIRPSLPPTPSVLPSGLPSPTPSGLPSPTPSAGPSPTPSQPPSPKPTPSVLPSPIPSPTPCVSTPSKPC